MFSNISNTDSVFKPRPSGHEGPGNNFWKKTLMMSLSNIFFGSLHAAGKLRDLDLLSLSCTSFKKKKKKKNLLFLKPETLIC